MTDKDKQVLITEIANKHPNISHNDIATIVTELEPYLHKHKQGRPKTIRLTKTGFKRLFPTLSIKQAYKRAEALGWLSVNSPYSYTWRLQCEGYPTYNKSLLAHFVDIVYHGRRPLKELELLFNVTGLAKASYRNTGSANYKGFRDYITKGLHNKKLTV